MRGWMTPLGALAMAACGSQAPDAGASDAAVVEKGDAAAAVASTAPDLAACPPLAPVDRSERLRTEAVAVPAALRPVMRSDMENFALSTLGGGTVCVDATWIETLANASLSPDGRFAAFDWFGYEAFGHVIVDRWGKGVVIDPGVKPLVSPSGNLLAAIDISEAGYGPLNAFTVWQLDPAPIRSLAQVEEVPAATDWKVERWAGETCVELSAIDLEDLTYPTNVDDPGRAPHRALRSGDWRIESGYCPAA